MVKTQQKVLQAGRRVLQWGAANPELVPPAVGDEATWSPLTRQLHALTVVTADFTSAAAQQGKHYISTTLVGSSEHALLKQLRNDLAVVTHVAHALRKQVPGISSLVMPMANLSSERLLLKADTLAQQAATYETTLVEHGLVPDFLARLQKTMSALRASIDGRGAATAARVSATKQVQVSVSLVHQYLQLMDAQLTQVLSNNPVKLAEWKSMRRVVSTGVIPAVTAGSALLQTSTPVATSPALVLTPTEHAEPLAA